MKTTFKKVALIVCGFFMTAAALTAQDMVLPVDTDVRIGQLPSGLTYYIRHNEKPKGQADFYIAQKVGSILENDEQRGLAHFLEHMCFNGTKNFPGNGIIDWLEKIGVKFGYNLNAYTSIDETVYNISNVPTANEAVQDTCLLILHDWANNLLLEDKEIDKERGVIHEEWRRSMVGQMRIIEKLLPEIYPDCKYGYRLPIGTIDVIDNFPYQALRDYYEAWYRPDQQAIIVVGDVDVDRIEGKIKEMFADVEMPENAPERTYEPVPDTPGTIIAIGSDPEMPYPIVQLMFKTDAFPEEMKGNASYLVQDYITDMITMMLNNRFQEMQSDPNAPFAQAFSDYDNFFVSKTKDALTVGGLAKEGNIYPVLEAIYREALRAQRGGFTYGEYERARDEFMSALEMAYNNRGNRENSEFVHEYVKNFTDNEPIPSIETYYQLMKMIVPNIPVEAINSILPELITNDNRIVLAMVPEAEGITIPEKAWVTAILIGVDSENIEPYVDKMKEEPLIEKMPKAGKIVSEKHNDQWDATEWELSNGAKVIIKPTKFKEDEILFNAQALGGTSTLPDKYATDLKLANAAYSEGGLGSYTHSDLKKYLSGKQVGATLSLDDYIREVSGFTTPKDLPTLMELVYMTFTNTNITEDEFQALQNMYVSVLQNQESTPEFIFSKDLLSVLYENPRQQMLTSADVKNANRKNILKIAKQMTENAADYTFTFVGNVDIETLRPLVEQYIASLPGNPAKSTKEFTINPTIEVRPGTATDKFTTQMQTPQTYAFISLIGEVPYTSKNAKIASIAGQILSKRLLDTVREEMGATYSIHASGRLSRTAPVNALIQSQFPMNPEMKEQVLEFIAGEIERMESNVTNEELSKVTEYMIKNAIEGKELNADWLNAITGTMINGVDNFNNNVADLQSITVDDIQNFIKALRAANNYRVVLLDPEN